MPHSDLVARAGTACSQPHPADDVLAEVDERLAARRAPHSPCRNVVCDAHGWSIRTHKDIEISGNRLDRVLVRRVNAEVGCLPVVNIIREDAGRPSTPAVVGREGVDIAVRCRDLELCEQGESVAVEGALTQEPETPAPPSVAQHCSELVSSTLDELGHVVRAVAKPVVIGRPTRGENGVIHEQPVDSYREDSLSRGVEPRARRCPRAGPPRREVPGPPGGDPRCRLD